MRIFISGAPVAQGRPRFARRGNFVRAYAPKKSREWKEYVRVSAQASRETFVLEGPLVMNVVFIMPRPKGLPKKVLHHVKKPDLDNLVKGIKDGLKGICYRDDSQIVELVARKEYGVTVGVDVTITRASVIEAEAQ